MNRVPSWRFLQADGFFQVYPGATARPRGLHIHREELERERPQAAADILEQAISVGAAAGPSRRRIPSPDPRPHPRHPSKRRKKEGGCSCKNFWWLGNLREEVSPGELAVLVGHLSSSSSFFNGADPLSEPLWSRSWCCLRWFRWCCETQTLLSDPPPPWSGPPARGLWCPRFLGSK